jgi:hypothetical protein
MSPGAQAPLLGASRAPVRHFVIVYVAVELLRSKSIGSGIFDSYRQSAGLR